MRKEYDCSNAWRDPYASKLMQQVSIRLDEESMSYSKSLSEEVGIPCQSLINVDLRNVAPQAEPEMEISSSATRPDASSTEASRRPTATSCRKVVGSPVVWTTKSVPAMGGTRDTPMTAPVDRNKSRVK